MENNMTGATQNLTQGKDSAHASPALLVYFCQQFIQVIYSPALR